MSIATYQISTKTLILRENGKILGSWHAVSGGAKNTKPLPTGIYTKITDPIGGIRKDQPKGYNDPKGNAFFLRVENNATMGRGFAIHPDGPKLGVTHGCIGITRNALSFYQLAWKKTKLTRLIVKY